MDCDPATRNVAGLIEANPELARAGIELRKFGLTVIEGLAEERVHPSWIVPGGVKSPMTQPARDRFLAGIPQALATTEKTLGIFKGLLDSFKEEIENFGSAPTMYAGLVDEAGNIQLYDGKLRLRWPDSGIVHDIAAEDYHRFIGEATISDSYLKAPLLQAAGLAGRDLSRGAAGPDQCHRKDGHAARRRRAARISRALWPRSAQLVPVSLRAAHRGAVRVGSDAGPCCRNRTRWTRMSAPKPGSTALEGVGMIEAPRGTLIHHYKVDENGAITWANLIVATGHNHRAISNGVRQVGEHFIKGNKLQEGMLNRVSALVRAYDPCLSCSTHAVGVPALDISLVNANGELLDRLRSQ